MIYWLGRKKEDGQWIEDIVSPYMSNPSLEKSLGRIANSIMHFQVEDKHKWHLS
jgi:hypothetical protein